MTKFLLPLVLGFTLAQAPGPNEQILRIHRFPPKPDSNIESFKLYLSDSTAINVSGDKNLPIIQRLVEGHQTHIRVTIEPLVKP